MHSDTRYWELSLSGNRSSSVEFYYEIRQGQKRLYQSERRSLEIPPGERITKSLQVLTAPVSGDYSLVSELRSGD